MIRKIYLKSFTQMLSLIGLPLPKPKKFLT